jgi:hypothetical protein
VRIMMASAECAHAPRRTCTGHLTTSIKFAMTCPDYPYSTVVVEGVRQP